MDQTASHPSKTLPTPPPLRVAVGRTLLRIGALLAVVLALHRMMSWSEAWITSNGFSWAMPGLTLVMLLIYALLIAIPFVPGVEIGLSVLVISGPEVAPAVWLATTLGLSFAYIAGCKVPYRWLHKTFLDMHLTGACRLLERFEALTPEKRVAFLQNSLPTRFGTWMVKYRYLALAILINIPGNSLIGGGGGIAMLSGLSGVFRIHFTLLTIALATLPVPLAIWLFDWQIPWY